MADRALFIGAPGNLSTSTIQTLLERRYQLAVYSHPTYFEDLDPQVRACVGDRHDSAGLETDIRDFRPDVVMNFVCFTPEEAEQTLPVVLRKVRQHIFISTVDVYGYPLCRLSFREEDPWNQETQHVVIGMNAKDC